jgi:hypothetical protein
LGKVTKISREEKYILAWSLHLPQGFFTLDKYQNLQGLVKARSLSPGS